jgi:hypothetical protein
MTKLENMPCPGSPCSAWLGRGLRADTEAARGLVFALSKRGDRVWRMCVPPQDDDADMLLLRVIEAAERLHGTASVAVEQHRECVTLPEGFVAEICAECGQDWPEHADKCAIGPLHAALIALDAAP